MNKLFFLKKKLKNNQGVTLIELLVIVSIIGILAGIFSFGISGARERARDTKREADIMEIHLAMENYYYDNYSYPANLGTLVTDRYLGILPSDPSDSQYGFSSDSEKYCVYAQLERGGFLAASQNGYGLNSATPTILNCW